jgi:16S rRNA (guanine527-N7)-methyltransferase
MPLVSPHEVRRLAQGLGRDMDLSQATRMATYAELLLAWNQRMNLVGARNLLQLMELIQDSWHLADFLTAWGYMPALSLDLGAGSGLPGIPLRIFWQHGVYVLVEPRHKRSIFLRHATAALQLADTQVMACPMEALPLEMQEADLVISRAFLPPDQLLAASRSCLRPGGHVVLMAPRLPVLPEDFLLEAQHQYHARGRAQHLFLICWRGHKS